MSGQAIEMLVTAAYIDISKKFPSPAIHKRSDLYTIMVDEYLNNQEPTKSNMLLEFSQKLSLPSIPKTLRDSFNDLRGNKIRFQDFVDGVIDNQIEELKPFIEAFRAWEVPAIPADNDINQLDVYIKAVQLYPELGKVGLHRRIFDNFHGEFPEGFQPVLHQFSEFLRNPDDNFHEILKSFEKAFDTFADGKGYSPDETIKYKSALFFKVIGSFTVGNNSANPLPRAYAQKTSGDFFAINQKDFMTLNQYYQEFVDRKIKERIEPSIGSLKPFDDVITELREEAKNLPKEFQDQLLERAEKYRNAQPSQVETKSSVSSQPFIDNPSSTKLSNSKLTTGDKIFIGLVTAASVIGVAISVAALIGGFSLVAPFVVPAVAAIAALTMIGAVLLSERIPFLSKLFSRKEPQATGSEQKDTFDKPADQKSQNCTTSQVLSKTSHGVTPEPTTGNVQKSVPTRIPAIEQKQVLSDRPEFYRSRL